MPTRILHNDASLIAGTDHASTWRKQPDSAFYESDTSFSQTSGTFSNGGITSVDFYNNTPNSILVESHMHIAISNGDSSNTITLAGIANLIAKMTVYVNNIEIFKVNSVNNCALMEQLQQIKDAKDPDDYAEIFNSVQGRTASSTTTYTVTAASGTRSIVVDMNRITGNMLSGLDNRAGNCDQDRDPVAHRQLRARCILIHACGCKRQCIQLLNVDQLLRAKQV